MEDIDQVKYFAPRLSARHINHSSYGWILNADRDRGGSGSGYGYGRVNCFHLTAQVEASLSLLVGRWGTAHACAAQQEQLSWLSPFSHQIWRDKWKVLLGATGEAYYYNRGGP